jgi:hypothetical protein
MQAGNHTRTGGFVVAADEGQPFWSPAPWAGVPSQSTRALGPDARMSLRKRGSDKQAGQRQMRTFAPSAAMNTYTSWPPARPVEHQIAVRPTVRRLLTTSAEPLCMIINRRRCCSEVALEWLFR